MASENKKKISRGRKALRIVLISVGAVVLAVIILIVLAARQAMSAISTLGVQSAPVERGTITSTIGGSGNLEAAEVQGIMLPVGITVDEVLVQTGDTVQQGDELATLNAASIAGVIAETDDSIQSIKDTLAESGHSSYEREQLNAQLDALQAEREELVALHDNPVVTATAAGIVSGIGVSDGEEITSGTSASSSSSSSAGGSISAASAYNFMSYTAGDEAIYAVSLSAAPEGEDPEEGDDPAADTPITDFSGLNVPVPTTGGAAETEAADSEYFSGRIEWSPADAVFAPQTVYTADVILTAEDGYVFTAEGAAALQLSYEQQGIPAYFSADALDASGHTLKYSIIFPETSAQDTPDDPIPSDIPGEDTPASSDIDLSDYISSADYSSSLGGVDYSAVSGVTGSAMSGDYSTHEAEVFEITLTDTVKLNISVDELDVLEVEVGQSAVITIDAVPDAEYEGTIARISSTASSTGGSAKYTAEITIPMDENMRIGMSASATVITGEAADVLTLPMAALQESGGETFVYTAMDENGAIYNPVSVTVGMADGTTAEITSGLNEGDVVYYTKTLTEDDFYGGMGGMGGMRLG